MNSEFFSDETVMKDECDSVGIAKWAASVDDVVVPMPRQVVNVSVLKVQAGISEERVLVRDHNSPNDVLLGDSETLDLGKGNVFYSLKRCESPPRANCQEAPKMAFFVDDVAEVVTRSTQTGASLRELFGLAPDSPLVRDVENQNDVPVELEDPVEFADGPVFYSRRSKDKGFLITVHNEDNGAEIQLVGTKQTTIDELIAQMYANFNIARQNDDRLRCEADGGDVFGHAQLTLKEYIKAGHCPCLVWLFAGGTGGAKCL